MTQDNIIQDGDPLGRTSMWRYRNFLPVIDDRNVVSMGEGMTPLLRVDRLGTRPGLRLGEIEEVRRAG
jgi:threonine synthase